MQTLRVGMSERPVGIDDVTDEVAEVSADPPGADAASIATLPPVASQAKLALVDLVQGARARYLWGMLGWQDIRRLYRRSVLGPFWLTISMGMLVALLGTLYGTC